jgi:hypothetical protein
VELPVVAGSGKLDVLVLSVEKEKGKKGRKKRKKGG